MAEDVSITYEKLFDLTRKEKGNEELQKLDTTFFDDLIAYLNDKTHILAKENQGSLFSKSEKEMTRKQLENIKKLIKDLYAKREQKIMNLAIMKSRTNSNLIDTSSLLPQEKALFLNMVKILNGYKEGVLNRIIAGEKPAEQPLADVAGSAPARKEDAKTPQVKVEFVNDVPKFVGKELETYGPFFKEQVVSLPSDVASILVNKGRARKVE